MEGPDGAPLTIDFDGLSSTDDEADRHVCMGLRRRIDIHAVRRRAIPSHPPGTYSVKLTVTDNEGATGTVTHGVSVGGNEPPTASFTWRASENDALTIEFDATASTDDKGIEPTHGTSATAGPEPARRPRTPTTPAAVSP